MISRSGFSLAVLLLMHMPIDGDQPRAQAAAPRMAVNTFTGRHDFNTPGRPVAEFVEAIEAPSKGMVWFDQSEHSPPWEEPEAFRARLLEVFATATRARVARTGPDLGCLDIQVSSGE